MPLIRHNCFMRRRHAYTSADIPWSMDEVSDSKFLRYLRGGGIRAFATSSARAVKARRERRFLVVAAILFAAWIALFFV